MKKALAISASLHLLAGVCLVNIGSKVIPPYLPGKFIDVTFMEVVEDPPAAVESTVEPAALIPPPLQTSTPDSSAQAQPPPQPPAKTTPAPLPTPPIVKIEPTANNHPTTNAPPTTRISEPQLEPTSGPIPPGVAENTQSPSPTASLSPPAEDSTGSRSPQKTAIASPSSNPDTIPPQNVRSFKPIYPSTARRQGYEGEVLLQATITTDGKPRDISVKESSGFEVLDHAAIRCLKRWRFTPALRAGTPVEWRVEIPVIFKLK